MKKLLTLSAALLLYVNSYCQKMGYKEIEIGKDISILYKMDYKFNLIESEDGEEDYLLVINENFKLCGTPVEYVKIWRDEKGKFKKINVVTKEIEIKDFAEYQNVFKSNGNCLSENVGKPVTINFDAPNMKNNGYGWDLKDEGIVIGLFIENMSTFAKNEKRRISLSWVKSSKQKIW